MNNQEDILKKIALGTAAKDSHSVSDLLVTKVKHDLERFGEESKDLNTMETYRAFKMLNLPINAYTRDMIHEAGAGYHTNGEAAYYTEVEGNIDSRLMSAVDDEERESIMRDILPTVPTNSLKKFQKYFIDTQDKLNAKANHKARAGQQIQFQNFLSKFKSSELDINRSLEAHVSDAVRGFTSGLGDLVEVKEGSFKIPGEGGDYKDIYSLPQVESLQDEFTTEVDLKPGARRLFKGLLDKDRQKQVQKEAQTTEIMFNNLKRFTEDVQTNIILDRAYSNPDEASKLALEGVSKQVKQDIYTGQVGPRARDIANQLRKYSRRVMIAMSERLDNAGPK